MPMYVGRQNPLPAWLIGAAVGEWVEIAGTDGAGLSQVNAFSGFVCTPAGRIISPLAGGHFDSDDNRTTAIDLMDDAPSWSVINAASDAGDVIAESEYYADGKPSSRHTYNGVFYVPAINRVMTVSCWYPYGTPTQYGAVDGLDLATNEWDAAGTYTSNPSPPQSRGVVFDGTDIWCNDLRKYNPVTDTWTAPISRITNYPDTPFAYDSSRGALFGLQWKGSQIMASQVSGGTETEVAINSSAAKTTFESEGPVDAMMQYDPWGDRFLFYSGLSTAAGRVYAITASGSSRDMSIVSISGTAPEASASQGIQGRFWRVDPLNGFVVLPQRTSNLFFFKVA